MKWMDFGDIIASEYPINYVHVNRYLFSSLPHVPRLKRPSRSQNNPSAPGTNGLLGPRELSPVTWGNGQCHTTTRGIIASGRFASIGFARLSQRRSWRNDNH
ncbi:hypothetical protein VTO73DRAFT_14759 [Trametes versicolor]